MRDVPSISFSLPAGPPGLRALWFMLRPPPRRQTIHKGIHDGLRPCHSTRPQLYRFGEHALAHKVEKAATLVAYAIKDSRETEETFFLGSLDALKEGVLGTRFGLH